MLFVVPTPIGNQGDITLRAQEILAAVDCIAAEDTRHSGGLLARHGISKPMVSFHEHNEVSRARELVDRMRAGEKVALISDAGFPAVSDPGYRLVRACIDAGIALTVLPGPSALLTALAGSGLPPHPFYFGGFLPVKSGRRQRELAAALERPHTSVYYESPHRIQKTLACLLELEPRCRVCVARELTKKFETYHRGSPGELLDGFASAPPKGEITLVLAPPEQEARPTTDDGCCHHRC